MYPHVPGEQPQFMISSCPIMRLFFMADILTCHSRKSRGVVPITSIKVALLFQCSALMLCMLSHWHRLMAGESWLMLSNIPVPPPLSAVEKPFSLFSPPLSDCLIEPVTFSRHSSSDSLQLDQTEQTDKNNVICE